MDRAILESYAAGADRPAAAIAGLSPAELDRRPVPDTWSIREIVVHLMDSDLISAYRMKRVIAEDNPLLLGYDEAAFALRLGYGRQDAADAAELFRLNRRLMAEILRSLPAEAFARTGVHSERGKLTLAELVQHYVEHVEHHLRHLHEKRQMPGK